MFHRTPARRAALRCSVRCASLRLAPATPRGRHGWMLGVAAALAISVGCKRLVERLWCAPQVSSGRTRGIAVVTGGSRGIGAAIAEVLAAEGYAVAVNYKGSAKAAEEVVARIRAAGGVACEFYADMAVEEDIVKMFDAVQRAWPDLPLSALVNNAGINKAGSMKHFSDLGALETLKVLKKEAFHELFDVNVFGALIASREFALRCTSGAIVNISSGSAVLAGTGLYGMTKAAMNNMQSWLVKELTPRGIRVNSVSPGLTRTDMIAPFLDTKPDLGMIPMGRVGEPQEIAEVVAFLLSEKASYVSGANLRVAGGRTPGSFIG